MQTEKDNLTKTNYAFIDSQNVNLGIRDLGWRLDFARFRVYLKEKCNVSRAYIFIGYLPGNEHLYATLQEMGYIYIFRPTLIRHDQIIKGNCDAELVLQATVDYNKYDRAIIVTGDGDFYCLANYLLRKNKLAYLLIPNQAKFSGLLKMKNLKPHLHYMNGLRDKLSQDKMRAP